MKIFKDRISAGKLLAKHLKKYKGQDNVVVLGIPRGGVVVAAEVAKDLNLPLDIIVTRKIGAPFQPELAVGAVDPDGEVVGPLRPRPASPRGESEAREVGEVEEIEEIVEKELEEIKRRENLYRQGKEPLNVEGKVVILVDDGIATGSTTLAAINYLKRHGAKKIILAVPVASIESVDKIIRELGPPAGEAGEFGEVIVLGTPENFASVGQFYYEFNEVTDEEVVKYLNHG